MGEMDGWMDRESVMRAASLGAPCLPSLSGESDDKNSPRLKYIVRDWYGYKRVVVEEVCYTQYFTIRLYG